jgi:hypothetical protein
MYKNAKRLMKHPHKMIKIESLCGVCLWVFKYTLNMCAFSCKILIVAIVCYATERTSMLLLPKSQPELPTGMDGSAPPINSSRRWNGR